MLTKNTNVTIEFLNEELQEKDKKLKSKDKEINELQINQKQLQEEITQVSNNADAVQQGLYALMVQLGSQYEGEQQCNFLLTQQLLNMEQTSLQVQYNKMLVEIKLEEAQKDLKQAHDSITKLTETNEQLQLKIKKLTQLNEALQGELKRLIGTAMRNSQEIHNSIAQTKSNSTVLFSTQSSTPVNASSAQQPQAQRPLKRTTGSVVLEDKEVSKKHKP